MSIRYKSKLISKNVSFIIGFLLVCLLSGCNTGKMSDTSGDNQITSTPVAEPSTDVPDQTDPEIENTVDAKKSTIDVAYSTQETADEFNETVALDNFSELKDHFIDYIFDVTYDANLDDYDRTFQIHGQYDLNGDGKVEEISAILIPGLKEGSYIEVNGTKIDLLLEYPTGEIHIIDLDNKDTYVEVAIYDDGPSGDPTYSFYRYDGKDFFYVGSIDGLALMDGQGKFISWFHLADKLNPQFFSAWGEFANKNYAITNHDVEPYIGKTYEVNSTAFFVPLDKIPENYYEHIRWEPEYQRELKGTKVKLLDIYFNEDDRTLNWFYVELPDGEKGLLYFWLGD